MRRLISIALAAGMLLATAGAALAAKPALTCPADASGHELVDVDGWWANTVEGMALEGIEVYVDGNPANGYTGEFEALANDFGFDSAQAFVDFIYGPQWDAIDRNGDGYACMKPYPQTPGSPADLFNGTDNNASVS
jgi:hypothetical protein